MLVAIIATIMKHERKEKESRKKTSAHYQCVYVSPDRRLLFVLKMQDKYTCIECNVSTECVRGIFKTFK
jgi:hypothetical protein